MSQANFDRAQHVNKTKTECVITTLLFVPWSIESASHVGYGRPSKPPFVMKLLRLTPDVASLIALLCMFDIDLL